MGSAHNQCSLWKQFIQVRREQRRRRCVIVQLYKISAFAQILLSNKDTFFCFSALLSEAFCLAVRSILPLSNSSGAVESTEWLTESWIEVWCPCSLQLAASLIGSSDREENRVSHVCVHISEKPQLCGIWHYHTEKIQQKKQMKSWLQLRNALKLDWLLQTLKVSPVSLTNPFVDYFVFFLM